MKKILGLLLALWAAPAFGQGIGAGVQIPCNNIAQFTGTGAAATVITGVAGRTISSCGWHITSTSTTSVTFQITTGTGATCGTGTVTVTPALNVTLNAPSADHIEFASFSAAPGANLCINAPASITGVVYYVIP